MKNLLVLFLVISGLAFSQITSIPPQSGTDVAEVSAIVQAFTPLIGIDAGSTDDYVITLSPVPTACSDVPFIWFMPNTDNTGAATLDCGPGAALPIYQNANGIDPDDDDLLADTPTLLKYCAACNGAAGAWLYESLSGAAKTIIASTVCAGDSILILDSAGQAPLLCLPTSNGMLEWFVTNVAVAADGLVLKALPSLQAGQITALSCAACVSAADCNSAASVTINLDSRNLSALHTDGTDLHTSEFTCDQDGLTTTTFAGDTTNAANQVWNLSVSAVTNATILRVWATVERE